MKAATLLSAVLGAPAALAMPFWPRADLVSTGAQHTMAVGTYPRITHMNDGSLLGTLTTFANGNTTMKAMRSTDVGRSWEELGSIAGAPTAQRDIDNPYALQLPSGRILAAYRNHDRLPNTTLSWTYFRIDLSYSEDGGSTWEFLKTVIQHPGPTIGDFEPFMRMADDGQTIQLYWSHQNSDADQDSYLALSTDDGETWTDPITISGAETTDTRDGMLGVTEIDGKLVAVFECKEDGAFDIRTVESTDGGATWGNRQLIYTPGLTNPACTQANQGGTTFCNAGAPQITTVRDTLVVSFMTDEDTAAGNWVEGANAKLILSDDGGVTWTGPITWTDTQSYWPSLTSVDELSFLGVVALGDTSVVQEFMVA